LQENREKWKIEKNQRKIENGGKNREK